MYFFFPGLVYLIEEIQLQIANSLTGTSGCLYLQPKIFFALDSIFQ